MAGNPYSTGSALASAAGPSGVDERVRSALDARELPTGEVLRRIAGFVAPHAGWLLVSFVAAAVSVVAQLYVPILIGQAIDVCVGAGRVDFEVLGATALRLLAVVAVASLCQWLSGYGTNRLSFRTVRDLRVEAYAKLNRLTVATIDGHPRGDLVARVSSDVDAMGDGLLQGLNQLLVGVVTIVGTLCFMLSLSVAVTAVVVVVTPLSILAAGAIARFSRDSFAQQQRLQGELSAFVEERVGNQALVRLFGREQASQEAFDAMNAELYVAGEHAQFVSSLTNPGTRVVNNLTYAAVALMGVLGLATGWPAPLTVGQVQSFLSYANQYMKPFNEISGVVTQLQAAFASARRLFALLDAPEVEPDAPDALELGRPRGKLEVRDVSFGYVEGQTVLDGVSFCARPGQRIAIVGPTGAGKTTIMNLFLRFYDPREGTIYLDDVDISRVRTASLRRAFGMVLQESWIFQGTVADNIAYGRPDATRAQIEAAAHAARADRFIKRLPQGYDTVLSEDGGSLSAGQRQLLCIARVMLADPPVLLLDEATSSIDTRTEALVTRAFDELISGRTSVVVAHRLSTVRDADCILVLDGGGIRERGTHDELLAAGGLYAELYRSQFAAQA